MKAYKRILSIGLSALLVLGAAMPALAAEEPSLKKEETVFLVLEPDGSVRSQTVSAHLHKEEGLRGVTDRSTLTGIENTQDTTAFTQSGEELTWDTDGADVYYKGESTRTAPISARITYALDGKQAPLEELLGQSGRLTITIDLQNNETGTVQVNGQSRPVCTPFVTMVAAVLGDDWENVEAPHGTVRELGKAQAAGFVCIPGVKSALDDLLPEELGELEDLLQEQVVLTADVTELSAPDIMIACAANAQELRDSGFSGLEKLEGLEDDMGRLDDGMGQLLDGAQQLSEGALALDSGAAQLMAGVLQLSDGAAQLSSGVASLQQGAHALSAGAADARDGAAALQVGADSLAAGLQNLQNGAGALSGGYAQLKAGSEGLVAGLNTLNANSQSLISGAQQLGEGVGALYAAAGPEGALASGSQAFGEALNVAAQQAGASLSQLPGPDAFSALLAGLPEEQQAQALAAYTGAYQAASQLSGGLQELNGSYAAVQAGISQVSSGAAALQQSVNGEGGFAPGLSTYAQGVANAAAGAAQLDAGLYQLGQNIPALTGGVGQLVAGSNQLSQGAGALSQGNAALAEGASQLAQGSDTLAAGISRLAEGITALASGAGALKDGTSQLAEGTSDLQNGLEQFNAEGVAKLTGAMDKDSLSTLREVSRAMSDRLEAYGSYAGAPEGAQVTTRFVLKTAQQPEAAQAEDDEPQEASHDESLWQRIQGLFTR